MKGILKQKYIVIQHKDTITWCNANSQRRI